MVVGITGGIGSGKSTIVSFLKENRSIAVYLADVEAKKMITSSNVIKFQLIKEFGKKVYYKNELNRTFLANIVFKNKNKLAILNAIVHPEVTNHFQKFIFENSDKDYILYENAILFENKSDVFCDVIITVTAPLKTRIDRVVKRDKTTRKAILQRIENQWEEEKKIIQSNYIIENNNLEKIKEKVFKIHQKLIQRII